jgi:hypothetical protein
MFQSYTKRGAIVKRWRNIPMLRVGPVTVIMVALARFAARGTAQQPLCTPVSNLFATWRFETVGTNVSEDSLRIYLEGERPRVEGLQDPFTRLFEMDESQSKAEQETVLWEDSTSLVIVDGCQPSPKVTSARS